MTSDCRMQCLCAVALSNDNNNYEEEEEKDRGFKIEGASEQKRQRLHFKSKSICDALMDARMKPLLSALNLVTQSAAAAAAPEYKVDYIVAHRLMESNLGYEFLVQWHREPIENRSWEPVDCFLDEQLNMTGALKKYIKKHNLTI